MAFTREELLSLIPHPVQNEPLHSSFATMMSEYSFWGQTAIMVQKLQRQAKHYEALAVGAMRTVSIIEKAIETLQTELDKCLQAEEALKKVYELSGRKHEQELGLMAKISSYKADPSITAAAAAITAADRARSSSLPGNPIPLRTSSAPPSDFVSPAALTHTESLQEDDEVEFDFNQKPAGMDPGDDSADKATGDHIRSVLGLE